ELRQDLERGVHRVGGEGPAVEAARAEAHHFLLTVDDLKGKIGLYLHHYHVDRVGADVDRRYPHRPTIMSLSRPSRRPWPQPQCPVPSCSRAASIAFPARSKASKKATAGRSIAPASPRAACASWCRRCNFLPL